MAGEIPSNARPIFITANQSVGVSAGQCVGSPVLDASLGLITGLGSSPITGENSTLSDGDAIWPLSKAIAFLAAAEQLSIASTDNSDTAEITVQIPREDSATLTGL